MNKFSKILIVFAVLFLNSKVEAQQLPMYSQYMLNGFLLNPAIAGSMESTPIILTARQQWAGITDAPQTIALSAHSAPFLNKKMGIGGYIFSDGFGPIARTGVMAAYSYHIPLNDNGLKLALGLSASAFQYKLDGTKLKVLEQSDNTITGQVDQTFVPDANFGAYLYSEKTYYFGFAAHNLIQWDIKIGDSQKSNEIVRHYFFNAGYRFDLKDYVDKLEIEPSILFKTTESSPMQIDVNTKAIYDRKYWIGFSYRTSDAIIAMLGIKVDKYYIGYSFDYTLSKLSNFTAGSHEIMLGFNLGEGANKGSSLL